jgi:hypothetical protein
LGIHVWFERCFPALPLAVAMAFAGMANGAFAQGVLSFECPARVATLAAELDEQADLRGFASRFPPALSAHLLRVTVQQGNGKDAADLKPQASAHRLQWELPAERPLQTTIWCQYEGGVALARVLRPSLVQCSAEWEPRQTGQAKGFGPTSVGLGRVNVTCQ